VSQIWSAKRIAANLVSAILTLGLGTLVLAQEITTVRIGTGATGGTYFPIGGLIANAVSNPPGSLDCDKGGSCGVPGVIATSVSTQGSIENVKAVSTGKLDMGLVQADIAYNAFTGQGSFSGEKPLDNLRAVANLYPEVMHLVVRRDSDIESVRDLKGKRVALGEEGSGTLAIAKIVLDAYDLKERDLKPVYAKVGKAGDMLIAGEIDAYFAVGGYPMVALVDTAEATDIRLISLVGPEIDNIRKTYRFLGADVIPVGTYQGVDGIVTLKVGAQLLTSAAMDDELVYGITRALWHANNRKLFDDGHPIGKQIELHKALDGVEIELHPGAARFYKEAGLIR
jgi:hypothetical protein